MRFQVVEAPFLEIPYADGAFDAVGSTQAFHHLPEGDKPAAVREMTRVLRKGGRLAIGDVIFYCPADLEAALRAAGLKEVRGRFQHWQQAARRHLDATAERFPEFVNAMHERLAQRILLLTQRHELERQRHAGLLPGGVAKTSIHELDTRLRRLRG